MPSAELRIEAFYELLYQRIITTEHSSCAIRQQSDG